MVHAPDTAIRRETKECAMHTEVDPETQKTVVLDLDVLSYDDWEDGEARPHICIVDLSN
jgi:hypothetical protein